MFPTLSTGLAAALIPALFAFFSPPLLAALIPALVAALIPALVALFLDLLPDIPRRSLGGRSLEVAPWKATENGTRSLLTRTTFSFSRPMHRLVSRPSCSIKNSSCRMDKTCGERGDGEKEDGEKEDGEK